MTNECNTEIENFWVEAGSRLDTIEYNVSIMQKTGYKFIGKFTLPEKCWTDSYFIPREKADKALLEKYTGNKIVKDFIKNNRHEVELFSKYSQYYGYVFYIGKKI